jgi:hypothetical protein
MSAEDNKALARRYWDEAWSTGNVAMIEEIFTPDNIFHSGGGQFHVALKPVNKDPRDGARRFLISVRLSKTSLRKGTRSSSDGPFMGYTEGP